MTERGRRRRTGWATARHRSRRKAVPHETRSRRISRDAAKRRGRRHAPRPSAATAAASGVTSSPTDRQVRASHSASETDRISRASASRAQAKRIRRGDVLRPTQPACARASAAARRGRRLCRPGARSGTAERQRAGGPDGIAGHGPRAAGDAEGGRHIAHRAGQRRVPQAMPHQMIAEIRPARHRAARRLRARPARSRRRGRGSTRRVGGMGDAPRCPPPPRPPRRRRSRPATAPGSRDCGDRVRGQLAEQAEFGHGGQAEGHEAPPRGSGRRARCR